jgi:hypothetical protein
VRRAIISVVGVALLAGLLRLVYGDGLLGYDTSASLLWGTDLAHGRAPEFESPFAPTPHPLSYAVLAPVSLLGDAAPGVVEAMAWLSLALLGYAAYRLGAALFGAPVGVAFAVVLLTRPLVVAETMQAFADIPCLALILLAAALEAERPRRGASVLVLLALAGLLRPEAWLFSLAYALWAMRGRRPGQAVVLATLGVAAPLVWALSDLLVAGDALHSLRSTQAGADRTGRRQGLGDALDLLPAHLVDILGAAALGCGLAGAAVALYLLYRRALLPAVMLLLGLASFVVLGVAELPLLRRYLLVSAAMLALFCAVAVLGWLLLERGGRERRAWLAGAAVAAAFLIAAAPGVVRSLRTETRQGTALAGRQDSLRSLLRMPEARSLARRCDPIVVPDVQLAVQLALEADVRLARIDRGTKPGEEGLFVAPAREEARTYYLHESEFRLYGEPNLRGYTRALGNEDWALWERC